MEKKTTKITTKETKTVAKPATIELPVTEAKNKTVQKAQTENVKMLTKDTVTATETSRTLNIDASVFDDTDEPLIDYEPYSYRERSRSTTIDGSMIASNRIKPASKRKQIVNTDFSAAERFSPDMSYGLSSAQVEHRREEGFVNMNKRKSGKSYPYIFLSNIFTFFNMLTFVVAIALIVVQAQLSQLFFMIIITANIGIGIFQEIRSKRAVDKLSIMTAPTAMVIRNGEKIAIPVTEVVLDDIMFLETGKQICSDAIVIKGEIEVNESLLTGESDAMKKPAGAELFSGSFVTSGNCLARVDKVGAANYVEKLSLQAKKYRKPKSELHNSIRLLIKVISLFIVPITIIMLYNGYINLSLQYEDSWVVWQQNIYNVSGAIIGMIPAGMFLLTSTALFVSVAQLARKKTLVQDLYCIEMLARVDVLCLDKTGTITDGSMQVNNIIEIKGGESQYTLKEIVGSLLTATGDNNQTAMALANHFGYSQALQATAAIPFSSQRKLSAASFEGVGTYMFGAPEFVLKDVGIRIEKMINENAANGYRVLCLAHSPSEIVGDKLPAVRRPVCLIVIEDHIRPDAFETIRWFKENNVQVKVISGDNPITVSSVAKRVGVEGADLYISLEKLSPQEVLEAANKYTVFGRVSPEQKRLLIQSMKAKGHTVAMTGDGVNDILAMREADCSVSIASGSEAARKLSHLVLMDSSFTSMPDVVREGRRVVNNIQKSSSLFLMKTLMSILLSIIFLIIPSTGGAVFIQYPYLTNNLLLLEVFIIALPSFVLALQRNENIIKGKFLTNVLGRCVPGGIALVVGTMAVYIYNTYLIPVPYGADGKVVDDLYKTMLVISLTLTGLMQLAKTCEPYDIVRSILFVFVVICVMVAIIFAPGVFGITIGLMGLQEYLFIATIAMGAYFLASFLMRCMRSMKILT